MIRMKIYAPAELLEHVKSFPAKLVRLADDLRLEVKSRGDLRIASERLFENGNTCVAVQ